MAERLKKPEKEAHGSQSLSRCRTPVIKAIRDLDSLLKVAPEHPVELAHTDMSGCGRTSVGSLQQPDRQPTRGMTFNHDCRWNVASAPSVYFTVTGSSPFRESENEITSPTKWMKWVLIPAGELKMGSKSNFVQRASLKQTANRITRLAWRTFGQKPPDLMLTETIHCVTEIDSRSSSTSVAFRAEEAWPH